MLRKYIIEGQAVNANRLQQLAQVANVMARIPNTLETRQVLDIVKSYTAALVMNFLSLGTPAHT